MTDNEALLGDTSLSFDFHNPLQILPHLSSGLFITAWFNEWFGLVSAQPREFELRLFSALLVSAIISVLHPLPSNGEVVRGWLDCTREKL